MEIRARLHNGRTQHFFRNMEVSRNGDIPKRLVYKGKSPPKMDDLGIPLFQETSISMLGLRGRLQMGNIVHRGDLLSRWSCLASLSLTCCDPVNPVHDIRVVRSCSFFCISATHNLEASRFCTLMLEPRKH